MSKIGYDCPPFISEWWCNMVNFETKTQKEKAKIEADIKYAEKYYPSVLLNDGNYVNFYFLQNVNLVAGENTAMYKDVWGNSKPIKSVAKGEILGVPEVYNTSNPNWIGLRKDGTNHFWVYIKPNTINAKSLYAKGVKNDEQQTKQKENDAKSWADKLGENIGNGLKWGAVAVGAYLVYDVVKDNRKQAAVSGISKNGQILIGLGIGVFIANQMGLYDSTTQKRKVVLPTLATKRRNPQTAMESNNFDTPIEGFNVYNEFI